MVSVLAHHSPTWSQGTIAVPDTLRFGEVVQGDSLTTSFAVVNESATDTVTIAAMDGLAGSAFSAVSWPSTLSPGGGGRVTVRFKPGDVSDYQSTLTVNLAPGSDPTVVLIGEGVSAPALEVSPATVSFDTVAVRHRRQVAVLLTNAGTQTSGSLQVILKEIVGTGSAHFGFVEPAEGLSVTIPGRESRQVTLQYEPLDGGTHSASMRLVMTSGDVLIPLVGYATDADPARLEVDVDTLDFGTVQVGVPTTRQLTLTNAGTLEGDYLLVSAQNIRSPAGASFELLNDEGGRQKTIYPGASYTFEIEYTPLSSGSHEAWFTTSHEDLDSLLIVGLGEPAVALEVTDGSGGLIFGDQPAGQTGTTKTVTVNNRSTITTLNLQIGTSLSEFVVTSGASAALQPGESTSVSVRFDPSSVGYKTEVLTIHASNLGISEVVELTGRGTGPEISIVQDSLDFGAVTVGTAAESRLAVQNIGTELLTVAFSSVSSPFGVNPATLSVAAGAVDYATVTYAPTDVPTSGGHSAALSLSTNSWDDSVPEVALLGGAIRPQLSSAPTSVEFPETRIGETASVTLTLESAGTTDLTISEIGTGDPQFRVEALDLPIVLGAGGSSAVEVTYAPVAAGEHRSEISISTNDPQSPGYTVGLLGQGTAPAITVSVDTLLFGEVRLGTPATRQFTLSNVEGTAEASINGIVASSSAFDASPSGGFTMLPNRLRTITVSFTPQEKGLDAAAITVSGDLAGDSGSDELRLYVTGIGITPHLEVEPATVAFGGVRLQDNIGTLTLRNTGDEVLNIDSLAVASAGEFYVDTESFTLLPDEVRQVAVHFAPADPGDQEGDLWIYSDDPDVPSLRVPLTGTGQKSELSYGVVDFGDVRVSDTTQVSLVVSNSGNAPVLIEAFGRVPGVDVLVDQGDLPLVIDTVGAQIIQLAYSPTDTSEKLGGLSMRLGDPPGGQSTITLLGRGVAPRLSTPDSLGVDFGRLVKNNLITGRGQASTVVTTIHNSGTADAIVADTRFGSGSDVSQFEIVNPLRGGVRIPAGGEAEIGVTYAPDMSAAHTAYVEVVTQRPSGLLEIRYDGRGIEAAASLDSTRIRFVDTKVNLEGSDANSYTDEVNLTSIADHNLIIDSVRVVGDPVFEVVYPNLEDSSPVLDKGNQQKIGIRFVPTVAAGSGSGAVNFSGALLIYTNETDRLYRTVALEGRGTRSTWTPPALVDFGENQVNGAPIAMDVLISNASETEATLSVQLRGNTAHFETDDDEVTVPAQGEGSVRVRFAPKSRNGGDPIESVLRLEEIGSDVLADVLLSGVGTRGVLEVGQGESLQEFSVRRNDEFGEVQSIVVYNTGNGPLKASVSSTEPQFRTPSGSENLTIQPQDSLEVRITFLPEGQGRITGTLQVRDLSAPDSIEANPSRDLIGRSLQPELDPVYLDLGRIEYGETRDTTLVLHNGGDDALTIEAISAPAGFESYITLGSNTRDQEIAPDGTLRVPLTITADAAAFLGLTELALDVVHESAEHPDSTAQSGAAIGVVVEDNTPPVVSLVSEVTQLQAGEGGNVIRMRITERTGVLGTGVLGYRYGGSSSTDYNNVPVVAGEARREANEIHIDASAQLPTVSADLGSRGVLYYVRVLDGGGRNEAVLDRSAQNRRRSLAGGQSGLADSEVLPREVRVRLDGLDGAALPGASAMRGAEHAYRLVSVPLDLDPGSATVASVLGKTLSRDVTRSDTESWRLYRAIGGETEEYKPQSSANWEFGVGQAYWIVVKETGLSLRTGAGTSVSAISDFSIPLRRGWNLVGTPFSFPVPWQHVYIESGGAERQIARIDVREFSHLYYRDANSGAVDSTAGRSDWSLGSEWPGQAMRPWAGYAVYSQSEGGSLRVRPLTTGVNAKPTVAEEAGWRIRVAAVTDNSVDGDNVLGVTGETSLVAKWPQPPHPAAGLEAYFLGPQDTTATPYSGDVRESAAAGHVWHLRVEQHGSQQEDVSLVVYGAEMVSQDQKLAVLNLGTMDIHDLRQVSQIFLGSAATHDVKIIAGAASFVEATVASTLPTRTVLRENYPNPFNASTVLRYTLSQPGPVQLAIFNVAGQVVRQLVSESLAPGAHRATWDGRDGSDRPVATGIYVSRLVTADGIQTRKLLLVK